VYSSKKGTPPQKGEEGGTKAGFLSENLDVSDVLILINISLR
jgi:hypothetical protein